VETGKSDPRVRVAGEVEWGGEADRPGNSPKVRIDSRVGWLVGDLACVWRGERGREEGEEDGKHLDYYVQEKTCASLTNEEGELKCRGDGEWRTAADGFGAGVVAAG